MRAGDVVVMFDDYQTRFQHAILKEDKLQVFNGRQKKNDFAEMRSGSEEGSYWRLTDVCITQL